jgi:hypothetical protein
MRQQWINFSDHIKCICIQPHEECVTIHNLHWYFNGYVYRHCVWSQSKPTMSIAVGIYIFKTLHSNCQVYIEIYDFCEHVYSLKPQSHRIVQFLDCAIVGDLAEVRPIAMCARISICDCILRLLLRPVVGHRTTGGTRCRVITNDGRS